MDSKQPEQQAINTIKAASILDLKPGTLRTWRSKKNRKLKYHKLEGGAVRYLYADVIEYRDRDIRF